MNHTKGVFSQIWSTFKRRIIGKSNILIQSTTVAALLASTPIMRADHFDEVTPHFNPINIPSSASGNVYYKYEWIGDSYGTTDCNDAGTTINALTTELATVNGLQHTNRGTAQIIVSRKAICGAGDSSYSCLQSMTDDGVTTSYYPSSGGPCDYSGGSFYSDVYNNIDTSPNLQTDYYSGTGWTLEHTYPISDPLDFYNLTDTCNCESNIKVFGWKSYYKIVITINQGYSLGMSIPPLPGGTVGGSTLHSSIISPQGLYGEKISAGWSFTLAADLNGDVWAWGANNNYQLGNGTTTLSKVPTPVSTVTDIIAVAAGHSHGLALKTNGTVWAWGLNGNGQLGDNSTTTRTTPVCVLSNVVQIAAGYYSSYAVKSDGTAWSWGKNSNGELGVGNTTQQQIPTQISTVNTDAVQISGGLYGGLILKNDGTVMGWGYNNNGQVGDGTTIQRNSPVQTTNLTDVIAVSSGGSHSLALLDDGTVWAWGANGNGRLGDGTTTQRNSPVQTTNLTAVVGIDGGDQHSLAVRSDGSSWGWGLNRVGEIGDGTTTSRSVPTQTTDPGGMIAITAGYLHSIGLKYDMTLRGWGNNQSGQLGDNTQTDRVNPVTVFGLTL